MLGLDCDGSMARRSPSGRLWVYVDRIFRSGLGSFINNVTANGLSTAWDRITVTLRLCFSSYCHTQNSHGIRGNVMWFPTQNDAVEMFARFLKARHGTAASKLARKTAASLQNEGDVNGCKIWTQ